MYENKKTILPDGVYAIMDSPTVKWINTSPDEPENDTTLSQECNSYEHRQVYRLNIILLCTFPLSQWLSHFVRFYGCWDSPGLSPDSLLLWPMSYMNSLR